MRHPDIIDHDENFGLHPDFITDPDRNTAPEGECVMLPTEVPSYEELLQMAWDRYRTAKEGAVSSDVAQKMLNEARFLLDFANAVPVSPSNADITDEFLREDDRP
jgi:hypothetical protein